MAREILTNLDFNGNQALGLRVEVLAADPTGGDLYEGRVWYNSTSDQYKGYANGSVVILQQAGASGVTSVSVDDVTLEDIGTASDPDLRVKDGGISNDQINISADLSVNSHKITDVDDPTSAQDAATKAYVDAVAAGLAPKDAVRAATTATGTLATAFENGDTIDGVTLATGDRILIKNQGAPAENGIYVVAASGAPARATDADSSGDLVGAAVFVSEGTVNGNTLWVMTTDAPITVDTTGLVWAQFGGPGAYSAGTGLTLTGTQFSLTSPVAIANGGTGQTSAAAALAALGGTTKFSQDVGDNSSTAIVVTHNLNSRDVVVSVRRATTPWDVVICDVEMTSVNTVTLRFAVAPTTNEYRITVVG